MDIKIIYSSGGQFNKHPDQKLADGETFEGAKQVSDALIKSGHVTELVKITPSKIGSVKKLKTDVVFNLVEWSGKDYPLAVKVLKNMEQKKIPYTGANSKNYEWCCDKISMKKMFGRLKITTPNWTVAEPGETKKEIYQKVVGLTFPIIIKPAYEHCAIGLTFKSVIHSAKGAPQKIINLLRSYNEPVLIEEFIYGREFTTTIIKNHIIHVFPPAEVKFSSKNPDKILSFKAKWIDTDDAYSSVVVRDKSLSGVLAKISKEIFTKMSCKGYARMDFRYDGRKIYVLDVNINPSIWPEECYGLTVSTQAEGWTFDKLVDEIASAAKN